MSLAIASLVAALLCWPAGTGRGRLGLLCHQWSVRPGQVSAIGRRWAGQRWAGQHWVEQRWIVLLVGVAAGMGALLAGVGGGLAAAMVVGTAAYRWRAGRNRRGSAAAAQGLSDALAVLVAELRAGAHAADAVGAAAADGSGQVSRALAAAAAIARLGGDIPAVLRGAGSAQVRPALNRLAEAWSLADRHGIPLADLLDAVRLDTEQRVRFATEVEARLAGPRATATVLAGLPLLGLALGQAVGAAPVRVLGGTVAGQVLLVVGTGLACVGVLWSARLIAGAVPA